MSPDSVSARETSVHLVPTAGWDGQLPPEELPGAWEPFLALRPERLASDQVSPVANIVSVTQKALKKYFLRE